MNGGGGDGWLMMMVLLLVIGRGVRGIGDDVIVDRD